MKKIVTAFLILLCSVTAQAQQRPVSLVAESADGKTLKLLWFLKSWEDGLTGFDIKRRIASGDWVKINSASIFPEISLRKSLKNVEQNEAEQRRLKSKLQQYLAQQNIREIPASSMLKQLSSSQKMLQAVTITTAYDYDLALITGFGLVDRTAVSGNNYEYGLFFSKNNVPEQNPAATFSWRSGTAAMLDPKVTVTAQPVARTKQIQLVWKSDTSQLRNTKISGYNVYKRTGQTWKKLTISPVANSGKDKSIFTYFDNTSLSNQSVEYGVALQSIFGNEGKKTTYLYNASEHPLNYSLPVIGDINSAGENFANGFTVNWTFPKEYEKSLKGFIVEKANLPQDYKAVSEILPVSMRSFTDKSFSSPASYVKFRVTVLYKDEEQLNSNEKMAFYLPAVSLAAPTNLTGKWMRENDRTFIDILWNAKTASDSLIQEYHLYTSNPFDSLMYLQSSLPPIKESHLKYEIFNAKASTYRIKIVPVSKYNTEGQPGETIKVYAPSTVLAIPKIDSYFTDTANRITLQWKYDEADVKGFKIFQNDSLLADDNILKKDTHSFTTMPLKTDERYVYTLQAINEGGVASRVSYPLDVLLYRHKK